MADFNFYSKKGKMKSCDDETKRLFEIGVTDGVKMQFVMDENAVKPVVEPVPKPVDTRPINVRLHEIIVDKIKWFQIERERYMSPAVMKIRTAGEAEY